MELHLVAFRQLVDFQINELNIFDLLWPSYR